MKTAQSAYVTGLRWERHTRSISSEVITDANPSRSGVLWHLFLFSGLAPASVPSRTCKSRQKTRDGRTGRPAQLSALSPFFSSPLLSYWSQLCHLCCHQSFSLPHPSPCLSLSVLDEDITPQPLPDTSASASFCQWFSPRSLMFQSELGQRASYSLYRCLLHARERDRDSYEVTSL